jgi:hypothetical protein
MSYNGSGTFQINTSGQPVVTGTSISSTVFNALTADLATGLSTAITKDGQTTTTARIPFALGINSTLVTDATNTTSGSIITAGGVGIAKAVFIGTTLNVAGASTMTGSIAVDSVTDSSSTTTGSIQTDGGVGIAKALFVGTTANIAGATTLSGGTANGVAYLNGSKALTTGSALVFDGTNFSTTGSGTVKNLLLTGGTLPGAANPSIALRSSDNIIYHQSGSANSITFLDSAQNAMYVASATSHIWNISNAEKARIDSSGNFLVGQTTRSTATVGFSVITVGGDQGQTSMTTSGTEVLNINRNTSDGDLVRFRQDNTVEGTISVSGTTVTYGGGHLARFGQLPDSLEDLTLLKGTVLTNLNEMCVWINKETGIPADNEQCNKVKISDVDGDANVAGVFVSWAYDEQHDTNDLYVAMTGDMIIRIAQGTTVARGDLLMSAGDGTAKPQGDDIVRSKTVAKVTSTHVTCTYADGSYCVPCVLMAC